jgi:predicted Zn-dependent protease
VMGGAFIGAMEQARASMEQKDYAAAARACETAALMRPENPMAWYNLAVARAGAGNKRRALEALEQAAAKGFSDAGRLDAEPLLAPLRTDARYEAVVKSIRK